MSKYLWKDSSQISAISVLLLKCQENRPHKMTFITSGSEETWKKTEEKKDLTLICEQGPESLMIIKKL